MKWRGDFRASRIEYSAALLKIDENVDLRGVGVLIKEAADLFVVHRQTGKRLFKSGGKKIIVGGFVEYVPFGDGKAATNAALALDRKARENELAHVVLEAFSDGSDERDCSGIRIEFRRRREGGVKKTVAAIEILRAEPKTL